MENDLPHKFLLFLDSQRLEFGKQSGSRIAHRETLPARARIVRRKFSFGGHALGTNSRERSIYFVTVVRSKSLRARTLAARGLARPVRGNISYFFADSSGMRMQ
jgi:hypothetical protein